MTHETDDDEVVAYLDSLSNSGRWGADDELGTLNLITPQVRLRGLASARDGLAVGCGRPIVIEPDASDVIDPPGHEIVETVPSASSPVVSTASDHIGLPSHGVTITHVDALTHFAVDGHGYNGRPSAPATAADPPAPGSVEAMRDGIVTRGVLVDVAAQRGRPYLDAGEAIAVEEIERWEREHEVHLDEGDALLLRTGWPVRRATLGPPTERKHRPGLDASALPWLRERGVAVVVSDAAHDRVPSDLQRFPMPIHTIGIVAMGLCLIDNADFERLAAACDERRRWSFLFVASPLRFVNATGSPVNPVAVL